MTGHAWFLVPGTQAALGPEKRLNAHKIRKVLCQDGSRGPLESWKGALNHPVCRSVRALLSNWMLRAVRLSSTVQAGMRAGVLTGPMPPKSRTSRGRRKNGIALPHEEVDYRSKKLRAVRPSRLQAVRPSQRLRARPSKLQAVRQTAMKI